MRQASLFDAAPVRPVPPSFHAQHCHMPVEEAQAGERRALGQDAAILAWMRAHPGRHTPPEVAAAFPQWPLTSVRRSLSNSTRRGFLRHCRADRRPGVFGALNSTWEAI